MDPLSAAFTPTPRDDVWRFHADMSRVQQTQVDHSERLSRLERRQEDDARMKSVWGTSSPFPGVLSGTPQQGPIHATDAFSGFDDSNNLIGSLHLDADEEPRRMGTTSRANSVRFDETANQGHWSHPTRVSLDFIPRTASGMSAHPMVERTYSHKSDGRQSSAGHSATSGRANSLGNDAQFNGLANSISPMEPPGLAPGMLILGCVPAIIRCWLNTDFKADSLLYGALCTGSYGSFLDQELIDRLDMNHLVRQDNGRKIKLSMYLPEAVTRTAASRANNSVPQLPTITVDFNVVSGSSDKDDRSIKIFIGSDILRAHNADILFSSNTVTLYDDEHSKLSVPLVRPEDERTFKNLHITSKRVGGVESEKSAKGKGTDLLNGLKQTTSSESSLESLATPVRQSTVGPQSPPAVESEERPSRSSFGDDVSTTSTRRSFDSRPSLTTLATSIESKTPSEPNPPAAATRSGTSPMIWSNWRRDNDGKASPQTDSWAKAGQSYQRREQGIKVLRPLKPVSRTFSATPASTSSPSPVTGQSRFFDEGKRRLSLEPAGEGKGNDGKEKAKDALLPLNKTRSANPVGGASAFSWLGK